MDFMADQLYSGRPIRVLTVIDNYSRESLALVAGFRLTGEDVAGALNELIRERGIPKVIRVDSGTEFTSRTMDQWAYLNGVTLDFSRPGKPTDNGLIEAFNGRLRAECLNEHWFLTLGDPQARLDAWRDDYNSQRPHGALKNMTPEEFAQRAERGHPPGGDRGPDDTAPKARKRRPEPCPTG
jgi:putative transposase